MLSLEIINHDTIFKLQVNATHFYFSGGKLFDNLGQAKDPSKKVTPNREVFSFNILVTQHNSSCYSNDRSHILIFPVQSKNWAKIADLPGPLYQHAMGIVSSRANGMELIFTAGLDENDQLSSKTNLLNLKTKAWREGPEFPKDNSIAFDRVTFPLK